MVSSSIHEADRSIGEAFGGRPVTLGIRLIAAE
jgi:hypothetical protein